MWLLLLLPLGLGATPAPPGPPAPPPDGHPLAGCQLCPHGGRALARGSRGASVALGCPAAETPLGRLRAEHWHFLEDPSDLAVCSRRRGDPLCHPRYGGRAALGGPPGTPGVLLLRHLRPEDEGTYGCLLLGERDCACGEVTLRLDGPPSSAPSSGTAPCSCSSFGLSILLLLLLPHAL